MPVCADCWRHLIPQSPENLCTICGEHLGWADLRFSTKERVCEICERARPPFQQAVAFGVYEDRLRALIHLLKYERVAPVAVRLGELLASCIVLLRDLPASPLLVPVPLHPVKERERSFNQTILLAESVARTLRHRYPHLRVELARHAMGRKRSTESQSGLTRRQRRLNLRGAFFVREPKQVAGRAVLLLDDIYTTGATARECAKTLLAAGAASVAVATLGRSQRESVALWDMPVFTQNSASMSAAEAGISISASALHGGPYATG